MKIWFGSYFEELRSNFWLVPTVMVGGAVALAVTSVELDKVIAGNDALKLPGWTNSRGPEGSRAVLSAVAGSMMTITSITFSITIVALQLASSQFGPRLLRNFMRDRGNQFALGTFIATFTYCLLVLRTVNGTENNQFVPHLSVTIGLILALASLGVLIYFIHHAASSIQAEKVISNVGDELHEAIEDLFEPVEEAGTTTRSLASPTVSLPANFEDNSRTIVSKVSDYIQEMDVKDLMRIAAERDLVIQMRRRPGLFVVEGSELARVSPADRVDDEVANAIRAAVLFGDRRTATQDVEFAIDQLVEVAVRALSPGINDPFTAISCVDRLGEALSVLAGRRFPTACHLDDAGRLRLVLSVTTPAGVVEAAFNLIRQNARGSVAVTLRLLETIAALSLRARDFSLRDALRKQAEMIHRGAQANIPEPLDLAEIDQRYRQAIELLDTPSDQTSPA